MDLQFHREVNELERFEFLFRTDWAWLTLAGIALLLAFAVNSAISQIVRRLQGYHFLLIDLADDLRTWVLFVWAYVALTRPLEPERLTERALDYALVFASCYQLAIWGLAFLRAWRKRVIDRRIEKDPSSVAAVGLMYSIAQATFIVIVILAALSQVGVNISAFVAGLGISGIAVALAAQNILGDLLASLSIVLDKPFVVGDFIVTDTVAGTVEEIGVKTTRLRSISGEQLVLSNKDLLESRIQNYKRMWERRVVQKFAVSYATPPDQLELIPRWVREIVTSRGRLRFDRCHLAGFGEWSLNFEFVFYVNSPDFNTYMDLQQEILLDIFRKFAREGVRFALPTRKVFAESLEEAAEMA